VTEENGRTLSHLRLVATGSTGMHHPTGTGDGMGELGPHLSQCTCVRHLLLRHRETLHKVLDDFANWCVLVDSKRALTTCSTCLQNSLPEQCGFCNQ
jgi:hypothetical protein